MGLKRRIDNAKKTYEKLTAQNEETIEGTFSRATEIAKKMASLEFISEEEQEQYWRWFMGRGKAHQETALDLANE